MKTFACDIYESGNLEPQTVFCYILDEYENTDGEPTADVEIKMPLYLQPSALRNDVQVWLEDAYNLTLGYLRYSLAPTNVTIHP